MGPDTMNLFALKYGILIGALLTTTAFVSTDFNPLAAPSDSRNSSVFDVQSIFAFGSQIFYKEVAKPGNEYMQSSVEGYSQDLVPNDTEDQAYATAWQTGVAKFESGYNQCTAALLDLATVPGMETSTEKVAVCEEFRTGEDEMSQSKDDFLAAKASTSPAVSSGFTIAMVLERVDEIIQSSDDADQSCMKAVLADHDHDPSGFSTNLKATQGAVNDMRRIYSELNVLSNDFT
jgi:hypothetical protein